ncbi:U3 small nucleolar RNA-associated protein 10 [Leucosporidium creatinivorum]|uniref:U3 small nucleolar RNA-associated protein 10 n=1 Tax=Leucosporidium creatinivorum TaxID=106004 RepID=A0A1Y2FQR3_9BASI|nr:U3 small nucleolar RNA-associated protein 10 [Leucosporidium creatinivorum]
MATSLAAQLESRQTLDTARLATAKSLKHPPSFIYTPRHAASVSTTDLHAIASNAWDQLAAIDPFFERYHNKILGEQAKGTDRTGLTKEENDKLDLVLNKVLRALGKHILLKPAGIVLEWLVRRFRVNDLNIPSLLALFLPYHTTPHFPSALSLIPESTLAETPFSPLIPARKSLAPLPLVDLIALLPPFSSQVAARPLLDFLLHLPLAYLEADEKVHRALVGFWLQAVAGYLDRAGSKLPEGERAVVLSTILEVIKLSRSQPDMLIASYILLARFSMHNPFEGETLRVVMKTVVGNRARKEIGDDETDAAFVTTLVVLSQLGEGEMEVAEGKKFLGGTGWKALMRVQKLGDLLVQLSNEYNAERFMKPFLNTLASEVIGSPEASILLSSLLVPRIDSDDSTPVLLPTPIIAHLTTASLTAILTSAPETDPAPLLKVLSQVYQRWPSVWEAETKDRTSKTEEEDLPLLWSIMNSVLGGGSVAQEPAGLFLSSSSPDAAVRVLALQDLFKASTDLLEENPAFVHDTLLARLREPVAQVAKVVLAPSTLAVVHSALNGQEIFDALLSVLDTAKLDTIILDTILPYLAGSFVDSFPELADEVLKKVFWSRLLSGKNDQKERIAGWKALKGSSLEKTNSWIKGVGATFEVDAAGELKNGVEANSALVQVIAKNLAALPTAELEIATTFLLTRLQVDSSTSERQTDEPSTLLASSNLLSILTSLALASKLDRSSRLPFLTAILSSLRATNRGLDAFTFPQPEVLLDDKGQLAPLTSQAIFGKPQSYKTLRRARAALLTASVAAIQPLKHSAWEWLTSSLASDDQARESYKSLVQAIYRLAHTGTTPGAIAFGTSLLRSIFSHLVTDDTIAFLASIWSDKKTPAQLKVVALKDGVTFLRVQGERKKVDFQTVVPAVLVALADGEKKVRVAAVEVLEVVQSVMPENTGVVYGRDQFYGAGTSTALKYLDVTDTTKYLIKLLSSRTELIMDGSYLLTLHQSLLDDPISESSKKSKATLKFKATTYLLSHILSWSSVNARTTLLRALAGIKDSNKGALVLPILGEVVNSTSEQRLQSIEGVEPEVVQEYGRLLIQPLEGATKKWVEQTEGALEVLGKALEITDASGVGAVLRKEALAVLGSSLFAVVKGEARVDVFKKLVRLATVADARLTTDVLICLRSIKVDTTTVTTFLNEIRLSLSSPVSKGAKRGRTSLGGAPTRPERLPELIVVLESLEFSSLSASHAILLSLFDLLSSIIEIPAAAQVDVQYPGQLMLSALSKVVENVGPNSGVTGDSIRMTPVLDLMRSSQNPQTYHQALLLLAQLGPLVPDQLVHNVMPIFTFMGANVLQRDDAYSLRVVEKTLESIVPALVKSTKRSSSSRDALVSDLKELLSIFTDAAAHVPRHRRISLFVRFVETLGAQEFLSAVAMLLVDKEVKAVDGTALPLALFENFSVDVQLTAFGQVIAEVGRLLEGEKSFLDLATDSNEAGPSTAVQEQVLNLLNFLALGLETKQLLSKVDAARAAGSETVDTTLSSLVRGVLDIHAPPTSTYSTSDKAELSAATSYGVQATVHLMSTQSFSEAILWLLDLADPSIQARALELLRTRLPNIKPTRRAEISPAVVTVVERIRTILAKTKADSDGALETLEVIATSVFAEEDAVLAKTVPELMAVARSAENPKSTRAVAIGILTKFTNRLGPRLIPLAGKLIPFAVEILKDEAQDPFSAAANVVTASFQVIEGLFMSIPTFIGAQVDKVFSAALSPEILSLSEEKHGAAAKARAVLLSTAAKKLPAKALYPAIIRLHASLDGASKEPILGLLDVLNRALRQGKTADIAENYRPIFKLFLTVFDLRREHAESLSLEDIGEIEENGLGAFVQFILKLNEQTFRPLFLRTYDWAVIDLADEEDAVAALTARRVVLYKLVDRLLTQLRAIVVPYFSFMLDQTVELLESFSKGELKDVTLWSSVVSALTKALDYDETGFWTPLRLAKLSAPIANQLEAPQQLTSSLISSHYHSLLAAYAQALLPHENHLKAFNTSLLMLTRSDDLRVKRGALEALDQVWESLGDGMLGLVPETTPFLAETMEEGEGGVESATRVLVKRIEEHLGESLSSYLES